MVHAEIVAFGGYVPDKILDNNFFAKSCKNPYRVHIGRNENGDEIFSPERKQVTVEGIFELTGIKERRIAAHNETFVDFVAAAFVKTGYSAKDLDGIIIGNISDPQTFPSLACRVQDAIGASKARDVYKLDAACSGFSHALNNANNAIKCGAGAYLVVGVDILSTITDYEELNCNLFGDGCGLVVLEPTAHKDEGILAVEVGSDTSGLGSIYLDAQRKLRMPSQGKGSGGQKVFKVATKSMLDLAHSVVEKSGISKDEVSLYIPHQANGRIVDYVGERVEGKVYKNIERFGNMSSATVPYALHEAFSTGVLKKGDLAVLVDFGAGFSKGAALVRI